MIAQEMTLGLVAWIVEQSTATPPALAAAFIADAAFADCQAEAKKMDAEVPSMLLVAGHRGETARPCLAGLGPNPQVEIFGGPMMFREYPEKLDALLSELLATAGSIGGPADCPPESVGGKKAGRRRGSRSILRSSPATVLRRGRGDTPATTLETGGRLSPRREASRHRRSFGYTFEPVHRWQRHSGRIAPAIGPGDAGRVSTMLDELVARRGFESRGAGRASELGATPV